MRPLALLALALLVALALPGVASAMIRPDFNDEACAWYATHVVLASEEKPGEYAVIESLEGDLEPGARIALPDLAGLVPEERRRLRGDMGIFEPEGSPRRLIGAGRVVLFLKRRADGTFGPPRSEGEPARFVLGDIDVSVAWIDGGQVFALVQVVNPGPPVMIDMHATEGDLRERVRRTIVTRGDLERAIAVAEPERRAEAIAPFARLDCYFAREAALEALVACGKPAVPALARLLHEGTGAPPGYELVYALQRAAASDYEAKLRPILFSEIELWRGIAPRLEPGWWRFEELTEETRPLYERHRTLLSLISSVSGGHAQKEIRGLLVDLETLWKSEERLRDEPQVIEACGRALEGEKPGR